MNHPHVIPIYDMGSSDGLLYVAMRRVSGTDLRQMIAKRGRLEPETAVLLLSQAAQALDAAHRTGLVHKDVRPGNLLIEQDADELDPGYLYIADFGISKWDMTSAELTSTGELPGAAGYVAPEQIRGLSVDGPADQYSLGCILYECLTGRPPFEADLEGAAVQASADEGSPPPSVLQAGLPSALDEVFARVLAKQPGDRYNTCREFIRAARGALDDAASATLSSDSSPALAADTVEVVPALPADTVVPALPSDTVAPALPADTVIPALPADMIAPALPADTVAPALAADTAEAAPALADDTAEAAPALAAATAEVAAPTLAAATAEIARALAGHSGKVTLVAPEPSASLPTASVSAVAPPAPAAPDTTVTSELPRLSEVAAIGTDVADDPGGPDGPDAPDDPDGELLAGGPELWSDRDRRRTIVLVAATVLIAIVSALLLISAAMSRSPAAAPKATGRVAAQMATPLPRPAHVSELWQVR
jgi:Protein kinase domain